jgi:hypothetical protein
MKTAVSNYENEYFLWSYVGTLLIHMNDDTTRI